MNVCYAPVQLQLTGPLIEWVFLLLFIRLAVTIGVVNKPMHALLPARPYFKRLMEKIYSKKSELVISVQKK